MLVLVLKGMILARHYCGELERTTGRERER